MSDFKYVGRLESARIGNASQLIVITEKDLGGSGQIVVSTTKPVLPITGIEKLHTSWLREKKTSDGAFIFKQGNSVQIHLFELKTTVGFKTWMKVIRQFEGLLLDILAMLGVLGSNWKISVVAYVAFQNDVLSAANSISSTGLKLGLGTGKPTLDDQGWANSTLQVLNFQSVPLVKIVRDASGNGLANVTL